MHGCNEETGCELCHEGQVNASKVDLVSIVAEISRVILVSFRLLVFSGFERRYGFAFGLGF